MLWKIIVPQSQTAYNLQSGRMLLLMFVLIVLILGLTHPLSYTPNATSSLLQLVTVIYALTVFIFSYSFGFVKRNLYYFVILVFYMMAADFLYQLYLSNFSLSFRGSFLIFSVVTAWYFKKKKEVLVYIISLMLLLFVVFLITSQPQNGTNYLLRYAAVMVFTFFFVGNRISTIQHLVDQDLHYKGLIERLNDGILQLDHQGHITLVNDTFCKLSGYREQELMRSFHLLNLIPEEDRERISIQLENWQKGGGGRCEMRLIRKNGEMIWVNVSASPNYDNQGKYIGTTSIITDITDRKVAEEELKQYSFELAQSNRELEQKNQELERFAQIASNDLKAPLQAVIKSVGMIQTHCARLEYDLARPYLAKVSEGCQHLNDLIDALLLYSISGSRQMNKQAVNLNAILREVTQSLDVYIKANNVQLTYPQLPEVHADRVQLIRLFRNLIENAIKFRGPNRPFIEINCSKHPKKEEYIFSVSDNGVGISQEFYEEIFQIFQQGDQQDAPGLGLGLAVCKKIVQNHGGRMWLKSTSGQGTTFYFTLSSILPEEAGLPAVKEPQVS
ncbi:MAG: PAS domain S-box protein [Bacteroidetes bacterium]|nr:MAG: PAS domain S-box protein [Bacteroidota bacterium]